MVYTIQIQTTGESPKPKFLGTEGVAQWYHSRLTCIVVLSPGAITILFLFFLIYLVVLALKSDTDRHGMKSKLGTSSPLLPVRDEKGPQLSPESPRLHGEVQTENLQQCY